VLGVVLIGERRGTDLLFAALLANNVNQIGAAELEIVFVAELMELLQVNACHASPPVFEILQQGTSGLRGRFR
jgi:hypothetical protein